MDREAWHVAVHGVSKSQTQLGDNWLTDWYIIGENSIFKSTLNLPIYGFWKIYIDMFPLWMIKVFVVLQCHRTFYISNYMEWKPVFYNYACSYFCILDITYMNFHSLLKRESLDRKEKIYNF